MSSEHSAIVQKGIDALRQFKDGLFRSIKAMCAADDGNMFPLDMVMQIAAKRALSNTTAFAHLIEQHNMVTARALLRVQIDNVLRIYALSLVDAPHEVAMQVMAGEKISRVKDRNGVKMRDAHLVAELGKTIEWLPTVYERTSGFIHLSDELLGFTMTTSDEAMVTFRLNETDDMPEASWIEVVECYIATSCLLLDFIDSWTFVKEARSKSA